MTSAFSTWTIGETVHPRTFGLAQKVQVCLIVHVATGQPIGLPGDPEGGDDDVRAVQKAA